MKKLIYALRFMTVIPIKWKEGEDLGEVARSISFFPFVGLIIGLSHVGFYLLMIRFFSPLFSSVLLIAWWVFITGGLHLDGLADTADGVWAGTTKERRLEIMKDSRTGVFGVITLISFLLLKTVALNEIITLHSNSIYSVLIGAPIVGRWISVFSIYFFPSARKEGLGIFFKENIGIKELLVSLFLTIVFLYFSGGFQALIALVLITGASLGFAQFFRSKLGGLTGDIYGALCEVAELLSIMVLILL